MLSNGERDVLRLLVVSRCSTLVIVIVVVVIVL